MFGVLSMNKKDTNTIRHIAEEVLDEQSVRNTAIKDGIFDILEKNVTVLYYPIDDKTLGFHVKRFVNDKLEDFVYINTSKNLCEQIFAAAHELAHIYKVASKVCKKNGHDEKSLDNKAVEDIADLFAAELLMPYSAFRKSILFHEDEMDVHSNSITYMQLIQLIVDLRVDFMVSYEAVRRRLMEVGFLDKETADSNFLVTGQTESLVNELLKQNNTNLNSPTNIKSINNIRSMLSKYHALKNVDTSLADKLSNELDIKSVSGDETLTKIKIGNING